MHADSLPSPAHCEQARRARDGRFDGIFFTAVRTTGIYCRPICPAPPAHQRNVAYFPSAAAAAAAGYRPCLRCRPELSPGHAAVSEQQPLQHALALLNDGFLQHDSAAALAAAVGLGPRQLQRIFVQQLGATPHQLHQNARLLLAKQLLSETTLPVTDVAAAAGFNSLRRFNAAFASACKMPPSALRKRQPLPAGSYQRTLRLAYRPPLDFPAMLGFLGKRALPGIEQMDGQRHQRVVVVDGKASVICVRACPHRDELLLELGDTAPTAIAGIIARVRQLFDLDADLRAVHACLRNEALLAQGIQARPGLRIPGGWDGFEIAARAVLGQQVSVAAATTLARRLVDRYGTPLTGMPAGLDRQFPPPEALAEAPLEQIGLPARRAATLRTLARACADGQLRFQRAQPLPAFIAQATALPGIGAWTAHYIAMRALSHPDAFPAGDLVLQQVLGQGQRLSERQAEQRSLAWQPWRAYAVLHLWHLATPAPTAPHTPARTPP